MFRHGTEHAMTNRAAAGWMMCAAGLLIAANVRDVQLPKPKGALQGRWEVVAAMQNGTADLNAVGDKVRFDGDKMTIRPRNSSEQPVSTFKVDSSAPLKRIDFTVPLNNGQVSIKGVYDLQGDSLKLCMSPPSAPRPKALKSEKGTRQVSLSLKRVKE
ncbi:MAG: TIGR03067 domain-containing protein [Planctomycetales bacterium]